MTETSEMSVASQSANLFVLNPEYYFLKKLS